jgi:metallothionein expression activator
MSTLDENWLQSTHSAKLSLTAFFEDYQKIKQQTSSNHKTSTSQSKLPLHNENFDSYLDSYNEVDDILSQTLNSLHELDIPMGNTNYSNNTSQSFMRGHAKKPSGTAIFGFAQHDKKLSLPGFSVAPNQVFNEKNSIQNEPKLFETIQDLEKNVNETKANDYIIPSEVPGNYKFPNEALGSSLRTPPADNSQKTVEVPVEYLQKLKNMIKKADGFEIEKFLNYNFDAGSERGASQSPVEIPVEKHTSSVRSSKSEASQHVDGRFRQKDQSRTPSASFQGQSSTGLGLQYEEPYQQFQQHYPIVSPPHQQPSQYQQHMPPHQNPHQSPVYHQTPFYGQPSYMTQQYPHQIPLQQLPPYQMQVHQLPPPPPPPPPQFNQPNLPVQQQRQPQIIQHIPPSSHIPQQIDTSESEFSDVPKTPSPTLKSQAKFDSAKATVFTSPRKSNISWTPVSNLETVSMSEGRKTHDKVSTLPRGEIDSYIIGPRDDKTYICNFEDCGKLFTRRYNARSHVQTHLSDRPHICDYEHCNKSFVRQHDLTRHKKVHTEFAHKCPCGKRFSRHDALFRHRQRQICIGALSDEEMANCQIIAANPPTSGSVNKPKRQSNQVTKIKNDKVAKRLEFDLVQQGQKSVKQHKSPIEISALELKQKQNSFDDKEESSVFYDLSFNDEFDIINEM